MKRIEDLTEEEHKRRTLAIAVISAAISYGVFFPIGCMIRILLEQ